MPVLHKNNMKLNKGQTGYSPSDSRQKNYPNNIKSTSKRIQSSLLKNNCLFIIIIIIFYIRDNLILIWH